MKNYDLDQEQILKRMDRQVTTIVAKMKMNSVSDPAHIIFDTQEVLSVLNISKRTLQEYRTKKLIKYSQIGSKIFYSLADILDLINKHKKNQPKYYDGVNL